MVINCSVLFASQSTTVMSQYIFFKFSPNRLDSLSGQSSAKRRTCEESAQERNSRGPRAVTWGTPDFTQADSEVLPSITTF